MKILFLSDANSTHTMRWVNSLAARGYEIHLAYIKNHFFKDVGTLDDRIILHGLPFGGKLGYYLNGFSLRKLIIMIKPDVMNAHYASGYGTLARLSKFHPLVLSVWGSDVYDFPYESRIKHNILVKNLRAADKIASTSNSMADQTRKVLGENGRNIAVTPFGVDTDKFCPAQKDGSGGMFTFGIVKTLSQKYSIDTIIRAFAEFLKKVGREEANKCILRIYGRGEQLEMLQNCAKELEISNQVFFEGFIENNKVPLALQGMDVFILSSESESFGVAAVEAMSCGLPVIATSVSGFREVMADGETGYIVPVHDYQAMAGRMLELYRDAGLREKMGQAGRERVKALYDWEKNVDLMEDVYSSMV